jgi:hypothetical protein
LISLDDQHPLSDKQRSPRVPVSALDSSSSLSLRRRHVSSPAPQFRRSSIRSPSLSTRRATALRPRLRPRQLILAVSPSATRLFSRAPVPSFFRSQPIAAHSEGDCFASPCPPSTAHPRCLSVGDTSLLPVPQSRRSSVRSPVSSFDISLSIVFETPNIATWLPTRFPSCPSVFPSRQPSHSYRKSSLTVRSIYL